MGLYLTNEREEDVIAAYNRYQEYLQAHRNHFPPNAFALGTSDWYYRPSDHRCPHDAWLEDLIVSETATRERHCGRFTTIRIRLLGAYQDGYIEVFYPRVFGYKIRSSSSGHLGDWLYDEFRLDTSGHLIHEIEWAGIGGATKEKRPRWIITASDVEFRWTAITPSI